MFSLRLISEIKKKTNAGNSVLVRHENILEYLLQVEDDNYDGLEEKKADNQL